MQRSITGCLAVATALIGVGLAYAAPAKTVTYISGDVVGSPQGLSGTNDNNKILVRGSQTGISIDFAKFAAGTCTGDTSLLTFFQSQNPLDYPSEIYVPKDGGRSHLRFGAITINGTSYEVRLHEFSQQTITESVAETTINASGGHVLIKTLKPPTGPSVHCNGVVSVVYSVSK